MKKGIGLRDRVRVVALDPVDNQNVLYSTGVVVSTFGTNKGLVVFVQMDESDLYRTFYLWQLERID